MKGSNSLHLNEATMIEAVQFWLGAQMAAGKSPVVNGVSHTRDGGCNLFIVHLTELAENKS